MEDMDTVTMEGASVDSKASSRDAGMKKEISPDSTSNLGCVRQRNRAAPLENGQQRVSLSQMVQDTKSVTRGDPRTFSRSSSVPSAGPPLLENMRIFVRVKPFPKGVKLTKEQQLLYQVDKSSLLINLRDVKQDMTKNVDVVGKHFAFSEAFGGDVNQSKIFERVVEPQVEKFFGGNNCTVMTYGAAESGKSYTLDGSHTHPGLIPNTLERIFSLVKPRSVPNYKPNANGIDRLSSEEIPLELEFRTELLSSLLKMGANSQVKAVHVPSCEEIFESNGPGIQHEVWISFLELRDEIYYDLLSSDCQTEHSPLKMLPDDQGKAFIEGLRHVSVASAAEAKDLLTLGRINLMRLHGMSSKEISKSHCIFTITLLKYQELNRPESVQMSRFSFCDLAAQKSPDIDDSLFSLTRCLKFTNENRHPESSSKHTEYFCNSKLTHLFKDALTGKELFSLIVNVDPNPGMYKETQIVLHSTAITNEILTKIRHPNYPKITTNFGQIALKSAVKINDWDDPPADKIEQLSADFNFDIAKLKVLNLRSDFQIRETMVNRYTTMIEIIDKSYKRRLSLIPPVKTKKKTENPEELESEALDTPESVEIAALKTMLDTLRTHKQIFERDLKAVETKLDNIPPELYETRDAFENNKDPALRIFDLEMELKNRKEKNDTLNRLLNDAREEVVRLTNESLEDKKKIGDTERKYVALKFERDNELILHRNSNYAYARGLKIAADLEMKLWEMERASELSKKKEMKLLEERELLKKEVEFHKEKEMKLLEEAKLCKEREMEFLNEAKLREEMELLKGEEEYRKEKEMEPRTREIELREEPDEEMEFEKEKEMEPFEEEMELNGENDKEMELFEKELELIEEKEREIPEEEEIELDTEEMKLVEEERELTAEEMKLLKGMELLKAMEEAELQEEMRNEEMELRYEETELCKEQEAEIHEDCQRKCEANDGEKATELLEKGATEVTAENQEELMETEPADVLIEQVNETVPENLVVVPESEIIASQAIPETPITLPEAVAISTTEKIETPEIQAISPPQIPVVTVTDIETITLTDEQPDVSLVPEHPVLPLPETPTNGFTTDAGVPPGISLNAIEAQIYARFETQINVSGTGVRPLPKASGTLAEPQSMFPVRQSMSSQPEIDDIVEAEGSSIQSDDPTSTEKDPASVDLVGNLEHVPEEVKDQLNLSDETADSKRDTIMETASPAMSDSTYVSCKSDDSTLTDDLSKSEPSDESPTTSESGTKPLRRSTRKRSAATPITPIRKSAKRAKPKDDGSFTVSCDNCKSVIRDRERYRCTVCPDYDVCLGCYDKNLHPHKVIKLTMPPPVQIK